MQDMRSEGEILQWARESIVIQNEAVANLNGQLNEHFSKTVLAVLNSKGRVIVTGIGKSAIIASKIVATLNSTGTPALFMHAADAIHGDLGMVLEEDIIICLSKSGNTPEVKALLPLIKRAGNTLVALVGNENSDLAKKAHLVIPCAVEKEACPNNLAPTASTTAQLVMGDALAVCLLKARGFTRNDFAKYHPGGSLGKRLYTNLGELAAANEKPEVNEDSSIKEILVELTKKRLGAVVVAQEDRVLGIITDGDIRRMLENHDHIQDLKAKDIMSPSPVSMEFSMLAIEAAQIMSEKKISQVVILENGAYMGMVHIHDLNREGLVI
jgi:arabinose-5-phosphate isomerase